MIVGRRFFAKHYETSIKNPKHKIKTQQNFIRRTESNVTNEKKNHKFRHEMTLTARNYIKRSQSEANETKESKQTDKERKNKVTSKN